MARRRREDLDPSEIHRRLFEEEEETIECDGNFFYFVSRTRILNFKTQNIYISCANYFKKDNFLSKLTK
jgi:hypothetical protein